MEKAINSECPDTIPRPDGANGVHRVGAQRDRSDEHVAVRHGRSCRVLLARAFRRRELGHGSAERGLRRLPPCSNTPRCPARGYDVAPRANTWSKAAKTDIGSPAVAAETPHALANQVIGGGQETPRVGAVDGRQCLFSSPRGSLAPQSPLRSPACVHQRGDQLVANCERAAGALGRHTCSADRPPGGNRSRTRQQSSNSEFDHDGPRPS